MSYLPGVTGRMKSRPAETVTPGFWIVVGGATTVAVIALLFQYAF